MATANGTTALHHDQPPCFDGFPYLLRVEPTGGARIAMLPVGVSQALLLQRAADALAAGAQLITNAEDSGALPFTHLLPRDPRWEVRLTETSETMDRWRYLRAWAALHLGVALPAGPDGWADVRLRRHSGAAKVLQRLRAANEVTTLLAHAHRANAPAITDAPTGFLRMASWHNTLPALWNAGLRNEWVCWLAARALDQELIEEDEAAAVRQTLDREDSPAAKAASLQAMSLAPFATNRTARSTEQVTAARLGA